MYLYPNDTFLIIVEDIFVEIYKPLLIQTRETYSVLSATLNLLFFLVQGMVMIS